MHCILVSGGGARGSNPALHVHVLHFSVRAFCSGQIQPSHIDAIQEPQDVITGQFLHHGRSLEAGLRPRQLQHHLLALFSPG